MHEKKEPGVYFIAQPNFIRIRGFQANGNIRKRYYIKEEFCEAWMCKQHKMLF